jgi:hypothetical protein
LFFGEEMGQSYSKKTEGMATVSGPFGEINIKTATCGHCNAVIMVTSLGDGVDDFGTEGEQIRIETNGLIVPKKEGSHVCHFCWSMVCDKCHADGRCIPMIKRIEEEESRKASLKSYGIQS